MTYMYASAWNDNQFGLMIILKIIKIIIFIDIAFYVNWLSIFHSFLKRKGEGMISSLVNENNYLDIRELCSTKIRLKIEGLNPAGSIKLKTAYSVISDLERLGCITNETILIESSSGNLGVALAMVCAAKGYKFTCVIDPNTSTSNRRLISTLGAEVIIADKRDENGGYLNTRIRMINDILSEKKSHMV